MLPVERGPDGAPWYVGFEWIGYADHLGEWPISPTRGRHVTSADAVVMFEHRGARETILIEWKYTELYSGPIDPDGNETRIVRYADKAFAPDGPIRSDLRIELTDFFYEPFYQLLRQQMLAWRMERSHENGAERVRVLHIHPKANKALHTITSQKIAEAVGHEAGDDAFVAFSKLLAPSADGADRFVSRTTESLFGPFLGEASEGAAWRTYLRDRYDFVLKGPVE
jgi:hypothetical protein